MPEFGEIRELDCGKCRKRTSHTYTDTRELTHIRRGRILRGWQCTSCKSLVIVQTLPDPDKEGKSAKEQ